MTAVTPPISIHGRIDEIPTRPSLSKARVVAIASVMLGPLGLAFWHYAPAALAAWLERNAAVAVHLRDRRLIESFEFCFSVLGVVAALCGAAGVAALLLPRRLTCQALRAVLALVYPGVLGHVALVWWAVFSLVAAGVEVDGAPQNRVTGFLWWWALSWPALAAGLYVFWLHVMLRSRSVYAAFTAETGRAMAGDHLLEDLRTHGRDPRARRSLYASVVTHVVVIVLIPVVLRIGGCVERYRVPKGSGNPVVALVKIVKPQKVKKKSLALRPNSAIIFDIPDLDDAEVDKVMEDMTKATYQASVNAKAGKMGKGGGSQGGWPAGMDNYKIRFIRLNHGGVGWDDGMDKSNADVNFLHAFAEATGFKNIAAKGESHSIALLDKYPSDGFPPFVYLTGNGAMGRVGPSDIRVLREYCLKGGMLIADAGSAAFDNSFRDFVRRVFPEKPLLDIADDDVLYQLPYGFPNGAPAFWHHGGRRALGVKHDGRWIVFYHPGDMNDAWKSPGYSDVTPEMRDAAMQLGVNLVYYSFNQWNDAVTRLRK